MSAVLTEVLELATAGDDAVGATAALAVAEAALARAEVRLQALPPAERATAAGQLAEARGLLARAARRIRGGDFGSGAWFCVVEAVAAAEAVTPSTDARAKGA